MTKKYGYIIMKFVGVSTDQVDDYLNDFSDECSSIIAYTCHPYTDNIVRILFNNDGGLNQGILWVGKHTHWDSYGSGILEACDASEAMSELNGLPLDDNIFTCKNLSSNTKEEPMSNVNKSNQYIYYIAFRWYGDAMESADWCRFMDRHFNSWKVNYRNRFNQDDDYGNVIEVLVKRGRDWDKIIEAIHFDKEFHSKLVQLEFDRVRADEYYDAWCQIDDLGLEGIFGKIDETTEDVAEANKDDNHVTWKVTVYFITHIRKTDHCRWMESMVFYTNDYYLKPIIDYWNEMGRKIDHFEIERVHGDCDDR